MWPRRQVSCYCALAQSLSTHPSHLGCGQSAEPDMVGLGLVELVILPFLLSLQMTVICMATDHYLRGRVLKGVHNHRTLVNSTRTALNSAGK